jgi:site-specific DNA-methyltransferase (adenine-specific)
MDKAEWDSFGSGKQYAEWATPWLKECYRVLKDDGSIYIFGKHRMLSHLMMVVEEIGFIYQNWITWDTIQGQGSGLFPDRTEGILFYSKSNKPYADHESIKLNRHEENIREYKGREYKFKSPSSPWRFPCVDDKHKERTGHPTQKPVELIERIVIASCPVEGVVFDCFMGSGTTGVACMKNRRHCVGIENNQDYIEISKSRFDSTEVG